MQDDALYSERDEISYFPLLPHVEDPESDRLHAAVDG